MNSLAKENMNIAVESLKKISATDLADLCNITEQAIKAGGGFGWLTIPPTETLKKYWNGLILIKSNIFPLVSNIESIKMNLLLKQYLTNFIR